MSAPTAYVYVIFRPDGRPCYVGKGRGKRWLRDKERSKHNPHFANIVRQAKCAGIELPRVRIRERLTDEEAGQIEIALIQAIGRKEDLGPLVNRTAGGDGVLNPSIETRSKIGAATAKRMSDPFVRARIGSKNRERQADPTVRALLRAHMLALRQDPIIGPLLYAASKGKIVSQDTRNAIGQKARERLKDPDRRAAISKSLTGKVQSTETKKKRGVSLAAFWDNRRQQGLPMSRPAKDEAARRLAIKNTMIAYRARVRDVQFGDDIQ